MYCSAVSIVETTYVYILGENKAATVYLALPFNAESKCSWLDNCFKSSTVSIVQLCSNIWANHGNVFILNIGFLHIFKMWTYPFCFNSRLKTIIVLLCQKKKQLIYWERTQQPQSTWLCHSMQNQNVPGWTTVVLLTTYIVLLCSNIWDNQGNVLILNIGFLHIFKMWAYPFCFNSPLDLFCCVNSRSDVYSGREQSSHSLLGSAIQCRVKMFLAWQSWGWEIA